MFEAYENNQPVVVPLSCTKTQLLRLKGCMYHPKVEGGIATQIPDSP
jgi:hypothetical protein